MNYLHRKNRVFLLYKFQQIRQVKYRGERSISNMFSRKPKSSWGIKVVLMLRADIKCCSLTEQHYMYYGCKILIDQYP